MVKKAQALMILKVEYLSIAASVSGNATADSATPKSGNLQFYNAAAKAKF